MNKIQLPVQQPKYGWEPNVTVDAAIHTSQNLIVKVLSRFLPLNHQSNGSGVILCWQLSHHIHQHSINIVKNKKVALFNLMVDFHILIENRVGTQHRNSHFLFSTPETLRGKKNKPTAMPDRRRTWIRHLFGRRSYVWLPFDRSRLRLQRL